MIFIFSDPNKTGLNFQKGAEYVLQKLGRFIEGEAGKTIGRCARRSRDGDRVAARSARFGARSRDPARRQELVNRTTQKTITFQRPFVLPSLEKTQPAGAYIIETEEELLAQITYPAYRRVATFIFLHEIAGDDRITGIANIDPEELEAALARDAQPSPDGDQP